MPTYFPDNNILYSFMSDSSIDHNDSQRLIELTGQGGKLNGVLVNSVRDEFEGTCGKANLNKVFSQLSKIAIMVNKSNSIPKFKDMVEKQLDYNKPSHELVKVQLYNTINQVKPFNRTTLQMKLAEMELDFTIKRKKVYGRLRLYDKIAIETIRKRHSNSIVQLRSLLDKVFLIKNPKDTKDNGHILDSILCSLDIKDSENWFVTCDNLRLKSSEFDVRCKELGNEISTLLNINFIVIKLNRFVNSL